MNESNEDLRGRIEKMLSNRQTSKDVDDKALKNSSMK
jgi:hypothetical protein